MTYYATNEITGNVVAVALTGQQIVRHPVPIGDDVGTVMCYQGRIDFPSGVNLAINDVIEVAILPADHVPVDWIITCDQFDSNAAPTLTVTVGIMTGNVGDTTRTQANFAGTPEGGAAIPLGKGTVTSPQYLRNGLFQTFANLGFLWPRVAPSFTADRSVGLTFPAAAATNPATTRRLDFQLFTRIARYGA